MAEITPAPKKKLPRLTVELDQETYERLMNLRAKTRTPANKLVADFIAKGLAEAEARLAQQ